MRNNDDPINWMQDNGTTTHAHRPHDARRSARTKGKHDPRLEVAVVAAVSCIAGLNLIPFADSTWQFNIFGRMAIFWLLLGIGVIASRFLGASLRWHVVLIVVGVAMLFFYVNANMLAMITASI